MSPLTQKILGFAGAAAIILLLVWLLFRFLASDGSFILSSTFERGGEEWTLVGDVKNPNGVPRHVESGGAPGGYLVGVDGERRETAGAQLDIVIAIDGTSSMGSFFDAARRNAIETVRELRTRAGSIRLGVVAFRDYASDSASALVTVPLSEDLEAQFAAIEALTAFGGGDTPEDQLLAIMDAVGMAWRAGDDAAPITRAVIVITDAPAKIPDHRSNTLESTAQAATRAGVRIYPIVVGGNAGALDHARVLAARTGGGVLRSENPAGAADLLVRSVETAIEQGAPWYWRAPNAFRGDVSTALGTRLSFSLKQSAATEQFDSREDVILAGAGRRLVWDAPNNPGSEWTDYSVRLDEAGGWRRFGTDSFATREELAAVLADLTDFRIRGEFRRGPDEGGLDNVFLVGVPEDAEPDIESVRIVTRLSDADPPGGEGPREVAIGQTLWVEVRLRRPAREPLEVTVRGSGESLEVETRRTRDDPLLFRSPPVFPWSPVQP